MKKNILITLSIFIIIGLLLIPIIKIKEKDEGKTNITVAEVTHSVFYAPQYVAKNLGYFEEENLNVEIILASGADKVSTAVLSGDVEIGLCGSEATIYIYNQGEEDYLVNFSALTKRDGSFIVSRTKQENFKLEDLKGKTIIGGRPGGMPEMTLEWILKENNIDPKKDVNIDTSIAFAAMSGAFISGIGDYVTLFEPNALALEKQNLGYVVASLGELGGIVPYTAYNAKKSYIENNKEAIEGFEKAIQKGLDYVHNNSAEDIASAIEKDFPDISKNDLVEIVKRYKEADSWFNTTTIEEKDFNHIQEIMKNAGHLEKEAPYNKLVLNE